MKERWRKVFLGILGVVVAGFCVSCAGQAPVTSALDKLNAVYDARNREGITSEEREQLDASYNEVIILSLLEKCSKMDASCRAYVSVDLNNHIVLPASVATNYGQFIFRSLAENDSADCNPGEDKIHSPWKNVSPNTHNTFVHRGDYASNFVDVAVLCVSKRQ